MPFSWCCPALTVFGSVMLWGGYFFGLFMVYLLGSWLPTVIKEAGMSVTEATMITALYQAGGTFGSLFAGWLMDRVNPHLALGMIYAAGGVATAMIGVTHAYFVILAVVAFSSGFCLNGRQHRHECAFRPLLPDGSPRHRLRLDAWRWPNGRHHECVCRRTGGQHGMGADDHVLLFWRFLPC
ncbi:MFS transporter [Dickeya fangzhongdai]|uniref:MFS transporter n=1 Tax=Dickeya fangzhongdai TaxID=1778540 RepID=UPI00202AFCBB|nr:MFS transporter [Dickeya fangzhongdai]